MVRSKGARKKESRNHKDYQHAASPSMCFDNLQQTVRRPAIAANNGMELSFIKQVDYEMDVKEDLGIS